MTKATFGFVGAGNMASALLGGMLRGGCFEARSVRVFDLDGERAKNLAEQHGVAVAADNARLAAFASVLFVAVKPGSVAAALSQCKDALADDALVVSVAAGVRCATLHAALKPTARIVRAMPNTPALVGAGATALCAGPGAQPDDLDACRGFFDAVGTTVVVDEAQMDAVTGLSGSGPAYVMLVIEALADGGVRAGLPRDVAQALATQTVLGSAQLLATTRTHPAELRDRVTSPGGTTAAGLKALEALGARHALSEAVERAAQRSRELAGNG